MPKAAEQTDRYTEGYSFGQTPHGFASQHPFSRDDYERGQRAANVAKDFGVDLLSVLA